MAILTALSEGFDTEHLTARRTVAEDREGLRPTLLNPGFAAAFGHPFNADTFADSAAQRWGEDRFILTLVTREDPNIVGFATVHPTLVAGLDGSLTASLEIAFDPAYHRRGFGFELMPALIGWAFDAVVYPLGQTLSRLQMLCRASNTASIGLMVQLARYGVRDLGEFDEIPLPTDEASHMAALAATVTGGQVATGKVRIFEVQRNEFVRPASTAHTP